MILNWAYCECGCKGFELKEPALKLDYWIWLDVKVAADDLSKPVEVTRGKYYLQTQHRSGKLVGAFDTMESADAAAVEMLDTVKINADIKQQIKALRDLQKRLS